MCSSYLKAGQFTHEAVYIYKKFSEVQYYNVIEITFLKKVTSMGVGSPGITSFIYIYIYIRMIDERWVDKATSNTARGTSPHALGFNTVSFIRRYNTHLWLPPHSFTHLIMCPYFSQFKTTSLPINLQP